MVWSNKETAGRRKRKWYYYWYYRTFLAHPSQLPFKAFLNAEGRRRRDRRIPRVAVRRYEDSPFKYLFDSGNDQALLNVTAYDHATFQRLVAIFQPFYLRYTLDSVTNTIRELKMGPNGRINGRKRELDATGCLGLVLMWFRTRGACNRVLTLVFGLTSTPLYRWLKFGRSILLACLQHHPDAKVSPPTREEILQYTTSVRQKYASLGDVWGAADGLKLPIEESGNDQVQNQFYNGWHHRHYVNSVFVFAPDGRIRMCTINCPGTFHDSTMAEYGLYSKMERVFEATGGKVVVDSAFKLGDRSCLIQSSQQDPMGSAEDVIINREATGVRQLSEWGMRMIQAQFPCLKDPLTYEEEGERRIILRLVVHLYNFQTTNVGINQILNSYMERDDGFFEHPSICLDASEYF